MMGTGDFAVPTFESLYGTPHQVVGLFTQPDRVGRGHHQSLQNAMKVVALRHETPVFQPEIINRPEALADLRNLNPDLFVVAAYGQILSEELLAIPRSGSINVHASLLPKYRGASPIATAILNGESETGVSIIQILPRLDAGPILAVARTPIGPHETAGELEVRLARLAIDLVPGVLEQIASGKLKPVPQTEALVTRAPKLKKGTGAIDWMKSSAQIDCHIRAMQPWPNPFTYLHSPGKPPQRLLVLAARPLADAAPVGVLPGTPLPGDGQRLVVATGSGSVEILKLQPDGKRPMTAADYLRGRAVTPDDRFGPESTSARPVV
ncbi:MAG: methionyl-tRNA formyltransferase [Planctomycetia bacterium]|nr:methionyl-tRNA formyltransferase [Planctomycetia bacterium]